MTWRFLDCGPGPGARQMATDEALLDAVARGRSPPILRVFAFQPACLSLGRFQVAPRDHHPGDVDIVRRPSGGRAVLHSGDLCYSVVARGDDRTVGGSSRESYRRIALALAFALPLSRIKENSSNEGGRSTSGGSSTLWRITVACPLREIAASGYNVSQSVASSPHS